MEAIHLQAVDSHITMSYEYKYIQMIYVINLNIILHDCFFCVFKKWCR